MRPRVTLFLLFTAAYILSMFYRFANAAIAGDLARDVPLSAADLGLMTSLFFAAFAAAQIPLGIALDRWGPRWVVSGLLLVGVAGSLVFAIGSSFWLLALGRVLLGLGMAGVLMGAYKAFSQWFSPRRFVTMVGLLSAVGYGGGLLSATPLVWLNALLGWRNVFLAGAGITALVAVAMMLWTRNSPAGSAPPPRSSTASRLPEIVREPRFWRLALLSGLVAALFGGFRGLWAGPYVIDVLGLDEVEAGNLLLIMGLGNIVGSLAAGWLAERLGMGRATALLALINATCPLALAAGPGLLVAEAVGFLYGISIGLMLLVATQARFLFAPAMLAQVFTLTNLLAVGGTFVVQWGMGALIGAFPAPAGSRYAAQGFVVALLATSAIVWLAVFYYLPMARAQHEELRSVQGESAKTSA